jgi:uncharacterized protein YkwD
MDSQPRLFRRALLALAGVLILTASAAGCAPPGAQSQPAVGAESPERAYIVTRVNNFRAANGLGPLVEASDAAGKAQLQAIAMASAGTIYHSDLASGIQPGWTTIGENVGYGTTLDQVESAFEASPPHRANMLSGSFNQIGVGVATGANGFVYVAQEFVGR